jgi:hypothetical protein
MNIRMAAVIAGAALALGVAVSACGSSNPSALQREDQQQSQDMQSLVNNQPLPHYDYSQERQALIVAENAAAAGTQTTSFFFNQGVADPVSSCPSIGLGVPDSASLSNPVQPESASNGQSSREVVPVGQMDPDGIYVPSASTGTFVNCVNAQGQEYLVRWEGFVYTVTGPAVWDKATGSVKLTGTPTMKIHTRAGP